VTFLIGQPTAVLRLLEHIDDGAGLPGVPHRRRRGHHPGRARSTPPRRLRAPTAARP
jgi:hypothetical protein